MPTKPKGPDELIPALVLLMVVLAAVVLPWIIHLYRGVMD